MTIEHIADLLRAIASLMWPLVAVVFILVFRTQITGLLQRVTKAKILGQEAEFSHDLDRLEQRAAEAEETTPFPPETDSEQRASFDDEVGKILGEATTSPKLALMGLSAALERRVRQLSAATGWAHDERTPRAMLRKMPGIPDTLRGAIEDFWTIRNRIVHGMSTTDDEALRALDSGLAIMRALDRIPLEANYVEDANVPLFRDPDGKNRLTDVHGLLLRTMSPEGNRESFRIFPTTRTHFVRGKQVAWEWAMPTWSRTWYMNPKTHKIELAWDSSMQFIGRHLDEV
jgi:hypothetical protein